MGILCYTRGRSFRYTVHGVIGIWLVWVMILNHHLLAFLSNMAVDYALFATDRATEAILPTVIMSNTTSVQWQDSSVCWTHTPILIGGARTFELPTAACGTLRRRSFWESKTLFSPLAQEIEKHQSDCSLPTAVNELGEFDIPGGSLIEVGYWAGIGKHLHLWSDSLCVAMEQGFRVQTHRQDWLWLDQSYCDTKIADLRSPLLCYFPGAECRCNNSLTFEADSLREPLFPKLPAVYFKSERCSKMKNSNRDLHNFRAAAMEYLFTQLSPLILREAERQVGLLFPNGLVPKDLVVVHIRWGDLVKETAVSPIEAYISAVSTLLKYRFQEDTNANIYLLTEDPVAVQAFKDNAKPGWKIYVERFGEEFRSVRPSYGNHASRTARITKGRSGLVNLGGLLVAMEADNFVLTYGSNWSRLIDELRKNVLDPRCKTCTTMIFVKPAETEAAVK